MKDVIFEESKQYLSKEEFKEKAPESYSIVLKQRWLKEMVWLDALLRMELSKEEVFNEAKQFKSKTSFYKHNRDLYNYARKQGWLEEMNWFVTKRSKWTRQEIFEEAR